MGTYCMKEVANEKNLLVKHGETLRHQPLTRDSSDPALAHLQTVFISPPKHSWWTLNRSSTMPHSRPSRGYSTFQGGTVAGPIKTELPPQIINQTERNVSHPVLFSYLIPP